MSSAQLKAASKWQREKIRRANMSPEQLITSRSGPALNERLLIWGSGECNDRLAELKAAA